MHVTGDISRGDYLVYTVNRNDGQRTCDNGVSRRFPDLLVNVNERCQLDGDSIIVRSSRSTQEGW